MTTISKANMRHVAVTMSVSALFLSTTGCGQRPGRSGIAKAVQYPTRTVQLMAPATPGGGWDLTARSIQKVFKDANLTTEAVEVYNVPGAAGMLGLAQLVTEHKGDPYQLMVTGLVMIGGVVVNKSAVDLTQTTPIATLTTEAEAIVVPVTSKYTTLKQLVDEWKAGPAAVKWGGGPVGGTDHILVGLLAKAAGVDPKAVKYVGHSGGEIKAGLLSGDLTAAVAGASEFKDLVAGGKARVLAVSGASPVNVGGTKAATLKDAGYHIELMTWRGVVAPPGISDGERLAIVEFFNRMHASDQWQRTLNQQGWEDFYSSGHVASIFFKSESTRIKTVLTETGVGS